MVSPTRSIVRTVTLVLALTAAASSPAIDIVLDYALDASNNNWFGGTPAGLARRAALDSAAGFLSAIITNDDWHSLSSLDASFSLSNIAAGTINDLDGNPVLGTAEEGAYSYTINTTNRSGVAANAYVIYVGAFPFGPGTAHARGGWNGGSSDRRNAAGAAVPPTEFNTWGGKIYFDSSESWYTGQNPGTDPTDDYGFQDPNKLPAADIATDNWDWNNSSAVWKGFALQSIDAAAAGKFDLYATAVHELIHVLGATSSNIADYLDVVDGTALGANVVAEFGGPVPISSAGGHFDFSVQSEVWDSDGILSEVSLDPNSLRGVRKYLTTLDAALLRDLGYQVSRQFASADFDRDGDVDAADLLRWQHDFAGTGSDTDGDGDSDSADFLNWQRQFESQQTFMTASQTIPEPSTLVLLLSLAWVQLTQRDQAAVIVTAARFL